MIDPLLFDTSVWVDYLRNKSNPSSDLLTKYIEQDDPVVLVPTILQEVLQGIREDSQYCRIKDIFGCFTCCGPAELQSGKTLQPKEANAEKTAAAA